MYLVYKHLENVSRKEVFEEESYEEIEKKEEQEYETGFHNDLTDCSIF